MVRAVYTSFGALLLAAACLKAWPLLIFRGLDRESHNVGGGWAIVSLEWLLGLWLLAGLWPRFAGRVSICVLVVFSAVSTFSLLQGRDSCGCFGRLSVNPLLALALDLFFLCGFTRIEQVRWRAGFHEEHTTSGPQVAFALCLAVTLPLGMAATALVARPATVVVLERPEEWVGTRFVLIDLLVDANDQVDLAENSRTVILFSRDCAKCLTYLDDLAIQARNGDGEVRVIDISLDRAKLDDTIQFVEYKLRPEVAVVCQVPCEIIVSKGVVISIRYP